MVLAVDSVERRIRVHYDIDNDMERETGEPWSVVELGDGVVVGRGLKHPMPEVRPSMLAGTQPAEAFEAFRAEMAGIDQPPQETGLMSAFGRGMPRG